MSFTTYNVQTPQGELQITPVGESISLRIGATVRGVYYICHLRANEENGVWTIDSRSSVANIYRPDKNHNHEAPSDSAKKNILQNANHFLQEWLKNNSDKIVAAKKNKILSEIAGIEELIAGYQDKIKEKEKELEAAKRKLAPYATTVDELLTTDIP